MKQNNYVERFLDYPLFDKEFKESGMPRFKTNFSLTSDNKDYLNYSSLFGRYNSNDESKIDIGSLKGFIDLKSFVESDEKIKGLLFIVEDSDLKYSFLYGLISDFIGGYIYKNGIRYSKKRYEKLLLPILNCLFSNRVNLDIAVPITLLQFEIESYKLNNTMEIVKMSDNFQLSRSGVRTFGYTINDIIKGCAKYALKINDYYLEYPINNYFYISDLLTSFDSKIEYIINSFFISIFLELNIYNGYAQIISIPKNWYLFVPKGNLIKVCSKSINNYPSCLEKDAWNNETKKLYIKELNSIKKLFNKIINCQNKSIEMSIDRLSRALLRENQEDAFLDILIGIEILLTDNEKTEVTYKLSMRITYIMNKINKTTETGYRIVLKELYKYRSAIVHGNSDKNKYSSSKALNKDCYSIALNIFRQVLKLIISKDELLESKDIPQEIDNMIINGFSK